MKKFEETVIKNGGGFFAVHKNGKTTYEIQGLTSSPLIIFGDWVSLEDHQAEIEKRKQQYEDHQEIYSKTAKKLNETELELSKLKTQLENQQPEIPEFVATEIYYRRYVSSSSGIKPSDGLLLMEVFRDLNSSHGICRDGNNFKEGKFYHWMQSSENNKTFVEAILDGYTVAKEKRFYLKDKNTKLYLWKDLETPEPPLIGVSFNDRHLDESNKFTQQEIDSMETGSYEQITVEENK